jgi:hypothetical protein
VEIGRAPVTLVGEPMRGTHAYVLLEGSGEGPSRVLPDRPARRWLAIAVPGPRSPPEGDPQTAFAEGRIRIDDLFARRLYDTLQPGSTVILTDEPLRRSGPDALTVIRAEKDEPLPPTAPQSATPVTPPRLPPPPED